MAFNASLCSCHTLNWENWLVQLSKSENDVESWGTISLSLLSAQYRPGQYLTIMGLIRWWTSSTQILPGVHWVQPCSPLVEEFENVPNGQGKWMFRFVVLTWIRPNPDAFKAAPKALCTVIAILSTMMPSPSESTGFLEFQFSF